MRIEQSGEFWVVHVDPGELEMRYGKRLPYGTAIGTINRRGTITVWTPAASKPHYYREAAQFKLEEARRDLFQKGALVDRKAVKSRKEEEKTGSFIVRLSTGGGSRFHDFSSANRWTEDALKNAAPGTRAEFFRAHVEGATPPLRTGSPFTEPFHVVEKNEHGHLRVGSLQQRSASYVSSRPWIVYRRTLGVLSLVSRYGDEVRAKERARQEHAFVKRIDEMDPSAREQLGLHG